MSGQRVAITGASGLIGTALAKHLTARGDDVVRLVRRAPSAPDERRWDPTTRDLAPETLSDVDAVVHLAGAGVADHRWTPAYKQEILRSRTDGTTAVASAVAAHGSRVRLVSGSAMGYYGSRGDEVLTERSPVGEGFLVEVVKAWEAATAPATEAGASVAMSRTGLVMGNGGGAFPPIRRLASLGLAGPMGSGRQWWSWIELEDVARALTFLVDRRDLTGPLNVVGPDPMRQRDVAKALATLMGRPAFMPAPSPALRVVLGESAGEVLGSLRVLPVRLLDAGFEHRHQTFSSAARALLG